MKRKVFLSLLAMGLTCMVLLTLIFGWMFRNYSRRQAEEELNLTLATVATGISQSRNPLVFLNTADLQENGIRVTWITASGRVLYDSMADSSQMESHEARPEFRAAFEDKAPHSAMMATIPTYVVTHPMAALAGLASYARTPSRFGLGTEGRRWKG